MGITTPLGDGQCAEMHSSAHMAVQSARWYRGHWAELASVGLALERAVVELIGGCM